MKIVKILLILLQIYFVICENSINLSIRNVINSVSERFVSFSTDFLEVYESFLLSQKDGGNYTILWSHLNPSYLKLDRLDSFLLRYDEFAGQVNKTNLGEFFEMLNRQEITPVVVISYEFQTFKPLQLLNIFKLALEFNMRNCVWQLGDNYLDFSNEKNVIKYSDDLRTLKILCETAKTEHQNVKWNIAGVGGFLREVYDDSQESIDVAGYDWKEFHLSNSINRHNLLPDRDVTLLNKIGDSIWVNVKNSPKTKPIISQSSEDQRILMTNGNLCDQNCLSDGLLFAHVLGEAAKNGYNVVYFNETFSIKNSNSFLPNPKVNTTNLKYYVMGFFKHLVARKVFNLKQMRLPFSGKSTLQFYGFCSKNMDGDLTFMGINYSNNRGKVNLKLNNPEKPAVVALQYLLSVTDGSILLNNEKIHNLESATPAYKFKKSSRNIVSFSLPPHSVGFWQLKNMKNMDCFNFEETESLKSPFNSNILSSSDLLLKHLLKGVFNTEGDKNDIKNIELKKPVAKLVDKMTEVVPKINDGTRVKRRMKRQLNFDQFDLLQPINFDLPQFPPIKLPTFPTNPIIPYKKPVQEMFSGNANDLVPDVYKLSQAEKDILKSSENTNLPFEDVYLSLQEIVTESTVAPSPKEVKVVKKKPLVYKLHVQPDSKEQIPSDYLEAYSKKNFKNVKKHIAKPRVSELFEAEKSTAYEQKNDQVKADTNNVELQMVLKELEPTQLQSKKAMKAAKKNLENLRILQVLENGEFQEISKDDINPADVAKLIDIAENVDDYEVYEDEDDGTDFFKKEAARRKRSLSQDYTSKNNEVKDYYSDINTLDAEQEDIVVPAVYKLKINDQSNAETPESTTSWENTLEQEEDESMTVKAVNYLGTSVPGFFQDIVKTFQKQFVGWWSLFTH